MNESAVVPRRLETNRWQTLDAGGRARVLERPGTLDRADLDEKVRRIIDDVRLRGDRALSALTERFDGVRLETFEVSLAEFDEAERSVPTEIRVAMTEARERLILWHRAGMAAEFQIDTPREFRAAGSCAASAAWASMCRRGPLPSLPRP